MSHESERRRLIREKRLARDRAFHKSILAGRFCREPCIRRKRPANTRHPINLRPVMIWLAPHLFSKETCHGKTSNKSFMRGLIYEKRRAKDRALATWLTWLKHLQRYGIAWIFAAFMVTWPNDIWHDPFARAISHSHVTTWLIHMTHSPAKMGHMIGFCRPVWLICTRDMAHSGVPWIVHAWRDVFTRDMSHSYVTWFIHLQR